MLEGLFENATHPQVYLVMLKVLQTAFASQPGQVLVFDNERLKLILNIMNGPIIDHYFSARYLCYKYIVRALSQYVVPQALIR